MPRRFLLFMATLLLATITHAQHVQIVKDMQGRLASRNFATLQSYIRRHRQICHWKCLRDIAPGFQEGVLKLEYEVPEKDNVAVSTVYNFRIQVISSGATITYYDFSEEKNRKVNGDWQPYFAVIGSYKNDRQYAQMQAAFASVFHAPLKEQDLFITGFVYGAQCGFVGTDPEGRVALKYWVTNRQKDKLLSWLQSANTERQLYAVEGLYRLKQQGVPLLAAELGMIKYVKAKKGTVSVCSGCIYSSEDIGTQTKEFIF